MSAPPRRSLRGRLARTALLVLVPLLLLEGLLRIAGPLVPGVAALLYHPKIVPRYEDAETVEELLDMSVLGFRPRTRHNDFILNSKSLHTREYAQDKPAGTLRALALGDSFTFASGGVPWQDLWHARLERGLALRTAREVEVLNLGIPAVGPEFERRMWQIEGSHLEADLVVLTFVVGSNFNASAFAKRQRSLGDRLTLGSYTLRFVRNALRLREARPEGRQPDREKPTRVLQEVGGVPATAVDPDFTYRYNYERTVVSVDRFWLQQKRFLKTGGGVGLEGTFQAVADYLVRFNDEVTAAGAEFVVMIAPMELQWNDELRGQVLARLDPSDPRPRGPIDVPQRFLTEAFERGGVRYLDLLPFFQAEGSDSPLHGLRSTHWNPEGNAVAERALLEFLTEPPASGDPWPWLGQ